jgi:hypothetical protein
VSLPRSRPGSSTGSRCWLSNPEPSNMASKEEEDSGSCGSCCCCCCCWDVL